MACILDGTTLTLTGDVGDMWYSDCFTHGDVVLALAQIDEDADLTVYLNSGGGLTDEGSAIHALLSRRVGTTDIVVDGVAASAASLIAMAGDTVTMSAGSIMMIHDPSGMTFGTSADHAKSMEMLEAIGTSYARVYAAKSGKTADECRAIMKAEKWLAPDEAVSEGFADKTSTAEAKPAAAWDYRDLCQRSEAPEGACEQEGLASRGPQPENARDRTHPPHRGAFHDRQDQAGRQDRRHREGCRRGNAEGGRRRSRSRRKSIMALDEAKGRESLATFYADETEDDVDKVKKALAAAPKATAAAGEDEIDSPEAHDRRQLNGQGLNGQRPADRPSAKGDKSVFKTAVARVNKGR